MCAIAGALLHDLNSTEKRKTSQRIINYIFGASTARGRDGYGYQYQGDQIPDPCVTKAAAPYHCIDDIKIPDRSFTNFNLILNLRAEPTTEFVRVKHEDDQQPYTVGLWSVVHNGTIANDKALRTYQLNTTIDSAAIPEALFCESGLAQGEKPYIVFKRGVRSLQGSYAILATHQNYPDRMFIGANYRPVWYAVKDEGVFFASSKEYFPADCVPQALEPYTVACFRYDAEELVIEKETLLPDPLTKPRALVVASGGLDSTVAASACIKDGYEVELIHFTYGCRAEEDEGIAIRNVAEALGVPLKFFPINIYSLEDSNLFNTGSDIAGGEEGAEFAHEWVPARNLVMLSVATAYAEARGFNYIVLGNNLEEAGAYPDNEPEFIRRFNDLLPFAVREGKRLKVLMPVGDLMKHEIVKLGSEINAPLDKTWSCYKTGRLHCGKCGPCFMRRTAFDINGLKEVIKYED